MYPNEILKVDNRNKLGLNNLKYTKLRSAIVEDMVYKLITE